MLDSKPVFEAKLISAGLDDAVQQRLIAGGIDTFAKLAFLAPVAPNTGDDRILIETLSTLMQYTDEDPMPPLVKAVIRRVWFESHAVAISEVKNKMERGDESAPRKLPLPEREDRRNRQQLRLVGISINGIHEPSHALLDIIHTMKEDNLLAYIAPEQCTHREGEIGGVKKESFMSVDATGHLKKVQKELALEADTSSTYKVRMCLQRRSLGLDQMDLLSYERSEQYHEFLYDLMSKTVPANYNSISLSQILQADKMIWTHMACRCRSGISRKPDGSLPVAEALEEALRDPVVMTALQPLPKSSGSGHSHRGKGSYESRTNDMPYRPKGGKGQKGKKGGKNRARGKGSYNLPMPDGLSGGHAQTKDGRRICFAFNLGSCQGAQPGSSCGKGFHVCCGCEASEHSFANCPRRT